MTRTFAALALSLSPMMLNAQAKQPVQPRHSSAVLESKLMAPSAVSDANTPAVATGRRISTGVIAPRLIHSEPVAAASDRFFTRTAPYTTTAVVSMIVDPTGVPSNLKIVRSVSPEMDSNILAAVKNYRFEPGTLNHEPTAVPLNLEITIQNAGW